MARPGKSLEYEFVYVDLSAFLMKISRKTNIKLALRVKIISIDNVHTVPLSRRRSTGKIYKIHLHLVFCLCLFIQIIR